MGWQQGRAGEPRGGGVRCHLHTPHSCTAAPHRRACPGVSRGPGPHSPPAPQAHAPEAGMASLSRASSAAAVENLAAASASSTLIFSASSSLRLRYSASSCGQGRQARARHGGRSQSVRGVSGAGSCGPGEARRERTPAGRGASSEACLRVPLPPLPEALGQPPCWPWWGGVSPRPRVGYASWRRGGGSKSKACNVAEPGGAERGRAGRGLPTLEASSVAVMRTKASGWISPRSTCARRSGLCGSCRGQQYWLY